MIEEGETLWAIAEEYLKNGNLHPKIRAANEGLEPDGVLQAGKRIRIPKT